MFLVSCRVYSTFSVCHIYVNLQELVVVSRTVDKTAESLHSREPRTQDTKARTSKVELIVKIGATTRVSLYVCININRSSGSDATKLTRKPISFAASQPLAEAKKAHKPQQQELQQLDKQLTGTGEKYDLFFLLLLLLLSSKSRKHSKYTEMSSEDAKQN